MRIYNLEFFMKFFLKIWKKITFNSESLHPEQIK
jgi:hypothetical protein